MDDLVLHSSGVIKGENGELATTLDEKLALFIDNLERKPYTDGWKEETWREEMEQHPFFTSTPFNPEVEPSPLIEGLQILRYDPEDNTPEDLARKYKEDANVNYKGQKYHLAVLCLKEGLKLKFTNNDLRAQMLNNLSASHFYLMNYRSCLMAIEEALKLKPKYVKAIKRAIHCSALLLAHDSCVKYCDKYLKLVPEDQIIPKIRENAMKHLKIIEMEKRKDIRRYNQEMRRQKIILDEINKRRLNIIGSYGKPLEDLAELHICSSLPLTTVHLVDNRLVWPVSILYPEYNVYDYIDEFHEDTTFYDNFKIMLAEKQDWDVEGKFTADTVNVYIQFKNGQGYTYKIIKLNPRICTLSEALESKKCPIDSGIPSFTLFFAGGEHEKEFIKPFEEKIKK